MREVRYRLGGLPDGGWPEAKAAPAFAGRRDLPPASVFCLRSTLSAGSQRNDWPQIHAERAFGLAPRPETRVAQTRS